MPDRRKERTNERRTRVSTIDRGINSPKRSCRRGVVIWARTPPLSRLTTMTALSRIHAQVVRTRRLQHGITLVDASCLAQLTNQVTDHVYHNAQPSVTLCIKQPRTTQQRQLKENLAGGPGPQASHSSTAVSNINSPTPTITSTFSLIVTRGRKPIAIPIEANRSPSETTTTYFPGTFTHAHTHTHIHTHTHTHTRTHPHHLRYNPHI